jgi:hypothetical protein
MKKRRSDNVFSMSFLDVMCCGFGAVVLLVMLLNGQTLQKRAENQKEMRAELGRLTQLQEFSDAHLDNLRSELDSLKREESDTQSRIEQLRTEISEQQQRGTDQAARQQKREIAALEKEKQSLEASIKKQKGQQAQPLKGKQLVGFDGERKRQYLTGLKLGGKRTLILVDASASMLDETVVNVVRRKLMDAKERRRAPKWQRTVRTLNWLVSNLQPGKYFQVYSFNTGARPAVSGTENRWLSTSNAVKLKQAMSSISSLPPQGGTSLHKAFEIIRRMNPKPDSVILLTDGLPTLGSSKTSAKTVSGRKRLALFSSAVRTVPQGVPVNILLFPMEGDPAAAAAFWDLAITTRGSFITPSRDWP